MLAQLRDDPVTYRLYPECDSMWPVSDHPTPKSFEQLGPTLRERGLGFGDVTVTDEG